MKRSYVKKRRSPSSSKQELEFAKIIEESLQASQVTADALKENTFFDSWIEQNRFQKILIIGDGNCLFRVMHYLFGKGGPEGQYYRVLAVAEMRRHHVKYKQFNFQNLDGSERLDEMSSAEFSSYLDAMESGFFGPERQVVYGDHLCLMALAEAMNVIFRIVRMDGPARDVPDNSPVGRPVHVLAYPRQIYSGPHYNLLVPLDNGYEHIPPPKFPHDPSRSKQQNQLLQVERP